MPFDKSLDAITGMDIEHLISGKVQESQHLDYKRDPYAKSTDGHRDFLKDVTAMANAYGGYLVIGVEEDGAGTGIPSAVRHVPEAASECKRLSNVALSSVDPRVSGLDMRDVTTSKGDVIVVRIPRSGNAPHMVMLGEIRGN